MRTESNQIRRIVTKDKSEFKWIENFNFKV